MLDLKAMHPDKMIVPTYDMDLMWHPNTRNPIPLTLKPEIPKPDPLDPTHSRWHTHMAFPEEYRRDSARFTGQVDPLGP